MSSSSSSSHDRAMNVRLCAFGATFFLLGLGGWVALQVAVARIKHTATWPSVTGRVVVSETGVGLIKTGKFIRATDVAVVRYAYLVNGQRYESEGGRVVPMLHMTSEGTPEEIVAQYPVGMAVAVYYDPENPADALLMPEPTQEVHRLIRTLTFAAIGSGFLGALFVVIGWMHLRAGDRAERVAAAEARRPATPSGHSPLSAPAALAQTVPSAAAAVRPRPTHWLLRLAQTLLGLFLLLFGGLLAVTAARTHNPAVSRSIEIVCLVLFAGVALAGGWLVTRGTRRPSAG